MSRFMEPRVTGFYVDVGAHHPFRFSNTALFSLRGWTGLNIEPDPEGAKAFRRYRPKDKVLNLGVASTPGEMRFFRFNDSALNTFSAPLAEQRRLHHGYKLVNEIKIRVDRLDTILSQNIPATQKIDFLSIDAEGLDLDVIMSNDWNRFRPAAVVAEVLDTEFKALPSHPMTEFMESVGYRLAARTANSVFFLEN